MALALDGSNGVTGTDTTGVETITLTTTQYNDVIVVVSGFNTSTAISSITSTPSNLSFSRRATTGGASNVLEEWRAIASAPLSGETISVTYATVAGGFNICAFGISGANYPAPFDTNGALPVHNTLNADPIFSTTNATTFVMAFMGFNSTPNPGTGSGGWADVYLFSNAYCLYQYKIFSSPQSSTTVAVGTGSGDEGRSIVDAVIPFANAPLQPFTSTQFFVTDTVIQQ